MTKNEVWVSRAMQGTQLVKNGTADMWESDPEAALDICRRAKKGEPLPAEVFPTKCYNDIEGRHVSNLPPLFEFASFWMVTSEMAHVLRQFNLGKTSLYPVELFQRNRRTRVPGDYFILSFGETKHKVDLEQSEGVKRLHETIPWELRSTLENGQVSVSKDALIGPDLWFEDTMWKAIFMSGTLVQALRDAKLTRRIPLRRCRLNS